jgi:hypothetical protein
LAGFKIDLHSLPSRISISISGAPSQSSEVLEVLHILDRDRSTPGRRHCNDTEDLLSLRHMRRIMERRGRLRERMYSELRSY